MVCSVSREPSEGWFESLSKPHCKSAENVPSTRSDKSVMAFFAQKMGFSDFPILPPPATAAGCLPRGPKVLVFFGIE